MNANILCRSPELKPLQERPYPGHVLISFLCDSDNKNLSILTDISVLLILATIQIWLLI